MFGFLKRSYDGPEGLPVRYVAPQGKDSGVLVVLFSGDGGFNWFDGGVARGLAAAGYAVVRVDSLRYFWRQKSESDVAWDMARLLAWADTRVGVREVVLAGFSFGADVVPFVVGHLAEKDRARVVALVLLEPGEKAIYQSNILGWVGWEYGVHDIFEALQGVGVPAAVFHTVGGRKNSPGKAIKGGQHVHLHAFEWLGNHHFLGKHAELAREVVGWLQGLKGR